jgi:hemerythrin
MQYIAWKNFYNMGDPTLDSQHKQIIAIINDLYDAMEAGNDSQVIKSYLDQLYQYTLSHFKHEEQIIRESGYPELTQHKLLHDRLRKEVLDLRDNYSLVTGRDLVRFLKQWWVGHIQSEDKKYAPYLELAAGRR